MDSSRSLVEKYASVARSRAPGACQQPQQCCRGASTLTWRNGVHQSPLLQPEGYVDGVCRTTVVRYLERTKRQR